MLTLDSMKVLLSQKLKFLITCLEIICWYKIFRKQAGERAKSILSNTLTAYTLGRCRARKAFSREKIRTRFMCPPARQWEKFRRNKNEKCNCPLIYNENDISCRLILVSYSATCIVNFLQCHPIATDGLQHHLTFP